jgi:hypothetical protein
MIKLGQKVYIIADCFEQNLPLGEHGFVIAYERNQDNAFDYIVRVPRSNKIVYVCKEDIAEEDVLLQVEVDRIEREALIDYALATKNESLFKKIMNGHMEVIDTEAPVHSQSPADFVKQINLKAWI